MAHFRKNQFNFETVRKEIEVLQSVAQDSGVKLYLVQFDRVVFKVATDASCHFSWCVAVTDQTNLRLKVASPAAWTKQSVNWQAKTSWVANEFLFGNDPEFIQYRQFY